MAGQLEGKQEKELLKVFDDREDEASIEELEELKSVMLADENIGTTGKASHVKV